MANPAINSEPFIINNTPYLFKKSYDGQDYFYAYVKGQGHKGKVATGVRYDYNDPASCLPACEAAMRKRFPEFVTDFTQRNFDFSGMTRPSAPDVLRLWQVIAFDKQYIGEHTRAKQTSKHDQIDRSLGAMYGKRYEELTVAEFSFNESMRWLKFLANNFHNARTGNLLSPVTLNGMANTLRQIRGRALNTPAEMGLADGSGQPFDLLTDAPKLALRDKDFRKHVGNPEDNQTGYHIFQPEDTAAVINALDLDNANDRDVHNWIVLAASVPSRNYQTLAINWQPGGPHIKRRAFAGCDDWGVRVPDTADNKSGGLVRVCGTLRAYLEAWDTKHPVGLRDSSPKDRVRTISGTLKRLCKSAGVHIEPGDKVTARCFRYTMATWLQKGVSLEDKQQMLGHGAKGVDKTHSKYTSPTDDTLKEAVNRTQEYWNEVQRELVRLGSDKQILGARS